MSSNIFLVDVVSHLFYFLTDFFLLLINFLYQVRPNYLAGDFELDLWKQFIAVMRVGPVTRELAQLITSNQVIG